MGFSYDLSTDQWQKLPKMWRYDDCVIWRTDGGDSDDGDDREHSPMDLMCEFRWNSVP